jgi:hypothetical protein
MFHVTFSPTIAVASSSDADIARATQKIASALEATIAAAPEQWYSFKPMWPPTDEEAAELAVRAERMLAGRPEPRPKGPSEPAPDAATGPGGAPATEPAPSS